MEILKVLISAIVIIFLIVVACISFLPGIFNKRGNDMYIIIGLGNPGREYAETKHNVGFRVIDRLADKYNIDVSKFKHKAFIGDGVLNGNKVLLVKPQTYMNLSGESVKEVMSFYKVPLENMIVIFDDISLPPGMIRVKEKGSAGGHNGIKNIIAHMGTDEFLRIKVGIGEKPNGWDLADYVLAKFSDNDAPLVETGIDNAVEAIEMIISSELRDVMNRFNKKVRDTKVDQTDNKR